MYGQIRENTDPFDLVVVDVTLLVQQDKTISEIQIFIPSILVNEAKI